MIIQKIVDRINDPYLAGELCSYAQLIAHMDEVIDDINAQLNSTYPTFTESELSVTDNYDYFPDRYIRNVVCLGAALKYFTADEEGVTNSRAYGEQYYINLYLMVRDYLAAVPEEYQNEDTVGAYQTKFTGVEDDEGINGIDFRNVRV